MKTKIYISFIILVVCFACKKSTTSSTPATTDCTGIAPTYAANIKTIIDANCATSNCHSANTKANGIDLSSFGATKAEAANARFIGSIEHQSNFDAMPRGASKLSNSDIKQINCWIKNGFIQ